MALLFASLFSQLAFSQVLNMKTDFIPNSLDSNNFYISYGLGYLIPKKEKNLVFQKSLLRDEVVDGNRLTRGSMEMVLFLIKRYDRELCPHFIFKLDFIPSIYLSSRFGLGVSSRSLNSSVGFFYGNYYRRVIYESNFITRRKRSFEDYPLNGFYVQSSSDRATFYFSLAFEKTHNFYSTRSSLKIGESLTLGKKGSILRSVESVTSFESISGFGAGLSLSFFENSHIDVLWIIPDRVDIDEQARLKNKLTSGVFIGFAYYVN